MTMAVTVGAALVLLAVASTALGFAPHGSSPFRFRASVLIAPLPGRPSSISLRMSTTADDATRLHTRDELLELISGTQRNSPTPKSTTAEILSLVKKLESTCPTEDTDVLESLAGGWELLWTAQVCTL